MRQTLFPKMLSKAFIIDSKALKTLNLIIGLVVLSTQLNEEMHSRFHTACNGAFRAQTFVPLCKRHFWSDSSVNELGNIFGNICFS